MNMPPNISYLHYCMRCLPVCCLLLWNVFPAAAQEYRVFKHKVSGPGSRVAVQSAVQSASGYMWFVTDGGLIRYNGNDEAFFAFDPGSPKNAVLHFDADTGYVGFTDGTVSVFREGKFTPVKWEEGTPKSAISALRKDSRGYLWTGTKTEGVYVHDGRHLYHFGTEDGLPDLGVNDLETDAAGNVWVATDRGLAKIRFDGLKKSVRVWDTRNGLPDPLVTTLALAGSTLYGGTHSGAVFMVDTHTLRVSAADLGADTPARPISALWADDTEIWGLYASGDLFMYSPRRGGEYVAIQNAGTGSGGRIRTLTADDEYNLWLTDGTENVFRIFRGILHVKEHEKLSLQKISSLSCDKRGLIYFSSEDGLFAHPVVFGPRNTMRRILGKSENAAQQVISVYADAEGDVWTGTFGNGLSVYHTASGETTRLRESGGFLNDNVLHISGEGHAVWAATLGGVAFWPQGLRGKMRAIGPADGMPVGFNYCVGADSVSGSAWVGTDGGGLVEIDPGMKIRPVPGGPSTVYCLSVFPGLGPVFSGQRPGLWAYNGRHVFSFSDAFRFYRITPTGLAVLPDSSVVVAHAKGFERFYPFRKSNTSFGETYGTGNFENALNALSVDEYGNCWLASDHELLRLSAMPPAYRKSPKTVLDQILVLSKPVGAHTHVFAHDQNALTFTFSGIWFQDEENVTFSYYMEGIDDAWRVTGDHYANYPALPPGKYTFRVKSSATGSFIHRDEVAYTFEIRKPFWQEAWFYLPSGLAVAFLFYLFVRARDRRTADRERMLKENAEFRFQVLKNQISPHFLFNSFNTLLYLIDSDKRKASGYTEDLSDFFRKVLEVREQNLITLREELNLMRLYASLQQARFEHALVLDVRVDEKYLDSLIPPLSGQMLLENAIKHNAISPEQPLLFRVAVDAEENHLVFANNIRLRRGVAESTGIGLRNIMQRYRLLNFPEPYIRQEGDTFTVFLPLILP